MGHVHYVPALHVRQVFPSLPIMYMLLCVQHYPCSCFVCVHALYPYTLLYSSVCPCTCFVCVQRYLYTLLCFHYPYTLLCFQRYPYTFNKGSLMNAGYQIIYSNSTYRPDCILFHDVDLLMLSDKNILMCFDYPVHIGAFIDKFNFTSSVL